MIRATLHVVANIPATRQPANNAWQMLIGNWLLALPQTATNTLARCGGLCVFSPVLMLVRTAISALASKRPASARAGYLGHPEGIEAEIDGSRWLDRLLVRGQRFT